MCNPPGGDWSGFSLIKDSKELRWISLPRVSNIVGGKRPDHIIEFDSNNDIPLLLSIESKERSIDLEDNVGEKLVNYVESLLEYIPSVERSRDNDSWSWGTKKVSPDDFKIVSAAAYLKKHAQDDDVVYKKGCEILFVLEPLISDGQVGWIIEIKAKTMRGKELKSRIRERVLSTPKSQITIK